MRTRSTHCGAVLVRATAASLLLAAGSIAFAQAPANQNTFKDLTPAMDGALPAIPGTAWKIDWGKPNSGGQVYLFCKTGRWEVVSPRLLAGALTMMGTYKVQGSNLVSKSSSDGRVDTYRMAWKDRALELKDGKVTMWLRYNGETQCK